MVGIVVVGHGRLAEEMEEKEGTLSWKQMCTPTIWWTSFTGLCFEQSQVSMGWVKICMGRRGQKLCLKFRWGR